MKNLGMFRFQPCAFPGCHDGDGGAWSEVGVAGLCGGHSTQYTATVALPSLRVEGTNQLRHEFRHKACCEVIGEWKPWQSGEIRSDRARAGPVKPIPADLEQLCQ